MKGDRDEKADATPDLESILKELVNYKHVGDLEGMSPAVQVLLREDQAREEAREAARRLRGRRPRERRRRREGDPSTPDLASRTHAGGSLDNVAAETKQTGKQPAKGVAGRTAEGGSCFNLSRGSFAPGARRQRQRRQQGGSLEDLSAIDEASAGPRASAAEGSKSGGSLQNLSQDRDTAASTQVESAVTQESGDASGRESPLQCRQVVIDISCWHSDDEQEVSRQAARALAAPCRRAAADPSEEREMTPMSAVLPRPAGPFLPSLEEGGGAVLCAVSPEPVKQEQTRSQRRPSAAAGLTSVTRTLGALLPGQVYTAGEVTELPSAGIIAASRRAQALDGGGGGGTANNTASTRSEAARAKKQRKKQEQLVTTDSVKDYRGHIQDVDTLISYIECGDRKPPAGDKPSQARRTERTARREVKTRRGGEERRAARRGPAKQSARPARSASLETRPPAGADTEDHSSVCGDLAQPRAVAAAAPALWQTGGEAYVNGEAAGGAGFALDFYSVAADVPLQEETEFLVVTRKQRRRREPAAAAAAGSRASLPAAAEPWRRQQAAAVRRPTSSSAPHSDAAASESDSEPAGARAAPHATAEVASSASSTVSVAGSVSSWADVARLKSARSQGAASRDAGTSTDFIDGVGAIFGDRPPARAARDGQSVRGAAKTRHSDSSARALIAGAHPDEFPEIVPTVAPPKQVVMTSAPSKQAVTTSAPSKQTATTPAPSKQAVATSAPSRQTATTPAPFKHAAAPVSSKPSPVQRSAASPVSKTVAISTSEPGPLKSDSQTWAVKRATVSVSASASEAATSSDGDVSSVVTACSSGEYRAAARDRDRLGNGVATVAPRRGSRRSPPVVISTDGASEQRTSVADIQFGYIDGAGEDVFQPALAATAAAKPSPSGVDGFCRRFRQQPVDVSQFNWREISVFLSKVYAEAVAVPGALFEEQTRLSCEARR